MDIEKILTALPLYFSDYFSAFFQTLQKPTLRFQPTIVQQPQSEIISISSSKNRNNSFSLNPKLISFVLLSIFIGSVIQGVTPNRPPILELSSLIIVVVSIWLLISSIIYLVFRMVGGRGGFFDTISVSLQLIAVIHVIASLSSLVGTVIFSSFDMGNGKPFLFYITTQSILFFIYLPLALQNLHFGSSPNKRIALVLATSFSILIIFIIVAAFGFLNIYFFLASLE